MHMHTEINNHAHTYTNSRNHAHSVRHTAEKAETVLRNMGILVDKKVHFLSCDGAQLAMCQTITELVEEMETLVPGYLPLTRGKEKTWT